MIASTTFLIQFLLMAFTIANNVSFKSINLIDSYTRNQNCTDLSHYFLIEAQLSVSKGSYNDDVFFSVPSDFDFFPTIPLNISNKGQQIASVYEHGTNMFGINFPSIFPQDTTINFNLLTKLTNSSMSHIEIGDMKNFTFRTNTNKVFNSTINFVGKDNTKMSTNGGSFANNGTAWFIADIPVSLLSDAVIFKSVKTGSNDYKYNTKATKLEVVTSFDSYGNPLTSVPFTAYTDKSTSDQIDISIDTRISGSGKVVRIHYFTEKLSNTPISNAVSLTQANYLKKRDFTDSTTVTVYGDDLNDEDSSNVVVNTPLVASSAIVPGHIATPIYSNNTHYSSSSSISTQSLSFVSQKSSSESSIVIPSGLITTSGAIVTPVAGYVNRTSKPTIITANNVIETYEIFTSTDGAIVTEIGSYVPVATIKPTTKIQMDGASYTANIATEASSIVASNKTSVDVTSSASIFSNTTIASFSKSKTYATRSPIASRFVANVTNELYTDINGVVETKTLDAILSAATDLVPIRTLSNGTVIESYSTDVTGVAIARTQNAIGAIYTQLVPIKSIHNMTTTVSCSTDIFTNVSTKTRNAIAAIYTQLVPVRSIHNLTTTVSCSTDISAIAITKTQTGIKTTGTSLIAIGTLRNKTSTAIGKIVSATTIAPVNSVYTEIVPLSTLSTHVRGQTSSTELVKNPLTKTIYPVKVTSTEVVAVGTIKATTQAPIATTTATSAYNQTTDAALSIQVEAPRSINAGDTTISVRPYEAGSNKLVLGLSSFIITILTTLL